LEGFKPKYRDRPDEEAPLDDQEDEESFFACLADVAGKLGEWCLEVYSNEEKLLPLIQHRQQYEAIYSRTI
jgi:hypothetical protein